MASVLSCTKASRSRSEIVRFREGVLQKLRTTTWHTPAKKVHFGWAFTEIDQRARSGTHTRGAVMGTFVVEGAFLQNITYAEDYTRIDRRNKQSIVAVRAWHVRAPTGVVRDPPTPVLINIISFGVFLTFSITGSGLNGSVRDVLTRSIQGLREYVDEKIHTNYMASEAARVMENEMYVSGVEVHEKLLVVKVKRASDAVFVAKHVRNFYSFKHHPALKLSYKKKKPAEWQNLATAAATAAEEHGAGDARGDYCAITDTDAVEQFLTQSKLTYTSHIVLSPQHVVPGDQGTDMLYVHMHQLRVVDVPLQSPIQLFQVRTPDTPEHRVSGKDSAKPSHESPSQHAARLQRHITAYLGCVKWAIDKGPSHHPAYTYKHLAPHDPAQFYHGVPPWWPDGTTNTAGVPPCADGADLGPSLRVGGMLM